MTADRALKRRVRARAQRTGESYTAALRHFRSLEGETVPTTPDHSPAQLRLAVAQTTFRTDPGDAHAFQEAGAEVRRLMRQARAAGADVIQFPEATLCFPDKRSLSRDPDQVTEADWTRFAWESSQSEVDQIRATAGSLGLWTVLGAQQRNPADPSARPASSLLVIDPTGTVVARYDERLLSRSKQAYLYAAGAEGVVLDVQGVRIALASGLEVLFPQVFSDYERQGRRLRPVLHRRSRGAGRGGQPGVLGPDPRAAERHLGRLRGAERQGPVRGGRHHRARRSLGGSVPERGDGRPSPSPRSAPGPIPRRTDLAARPARASLDARSDRSRCPAAAADHRVRHWRPPSPMRPGRIEQRHAVDPDAAGFAIVGLEDLTDTCWTDSATALGLVPGGGGEVDRDVGDQRRSWSPDPVGSARNPGRAEDPGPGTGSSRSVPAGRRRPRRAR